MAGAAAAQPPGYELVLVDLDGDKEVLGVLPPSVFAPRISPDGTSVVFEALEPSGSSDERRARLWVAELSDLESRRPLPFVDGPMNWAAMWTVDGERLVFLVSSERPDALFWQHADGTGGAERLVDARSAEAFTPDGSQLAFLTLRGNRDYGISLLDMQSRTATELIDLPDSAQHSSNVSPDGRWIAYASNETGRYEVWIALLSQPGERRQITHDGGGHPLWSRDGTSIFLDRDNQLFVVDVRTEGEVTIGEPVALPISGFQQGEYRRQFDLMPNGRQLLLLFEPATSVDEQR
jgi:eukaryotic-like serine/threonine-protein kinase